MRRVGEVVRTAQGLAIARSPDDSYPDEGQHLVDESLDEVGAVVAVFGPVERPYVAVSPDGEVDPSLVGTVLYARD